MGFFLYKGLKKPLVFFGLKDKYIYYAMGTAVGGLFCAAIFSSLIGISELSDHHVKIPIVFAAVVIAVERDVHFNFFLFHCFAHLG